MVAINLIKIKAVVFDMDGVLIDSEKYHLQAYNDIFEELNLGMYLSREDFKRFFGRGAKQIIFQLFKENKIKEDPVKYATLKDKRFREIIKKYAKPLPGVVELIKSLSKEYRLCVASSAAYENVKLITKLLKVDKYLEFFISGDDVKDTKPSPEIYLKAAKKLKLNASECVVIEDANLGVQAAKSAGMKCIAVTNTLPKEKLRQADLIVTSLENVNNETIKRFDFVEINNSKLKPNKKDPNSDKTKTISVPGSKSYTNRALLVAALAEGKSVIRNPLFSDDTKYMIDALKQLGVKIVVNNIKKKNTNAAKEGSITVYGTSGKLKAPKKEIFVGNAGTAMRFLSAASTLADGKVVLTGEPRMLERPIDDLVDALKQLGVKASAKNNCPPVTVFGNNKNKAGASKFLGGKCRINGAKSSQFLSALLMIAPFAEHDVEIEIVGELASKPFVDITIDVMHRFGVEVENTNYKKFKIKTGQWYDAHNYVIEGDASNTSYFFGIAAVTGRKIRVENINPKTVQGDIKFVNLLQEMGCEVLFGDNKESNFIEVEGPKNNLKAIDVDMNSMPDVVQTLAVVALFANGITRIRNVSNLRIKETDRLHAMATELRKLGGDVEELESGLEIKGCGEDLKRLHCAEINTYNDHRMAMCFAIAAFKIPGIKILNPSCVNKTFPEYWEKLKQL
ncbi:TPA: 3-phosphoshikimate 1-carboxyvinyltransferase [Candidatus Woesearchaeota archaeon]|nr:3-phosphoshikimate 1-carboxyvinyltransferase [Candidatus Woesearchaeota archaeon]